MEDVVKHKCCIFSLRPWTHLQYILSLQLTWCFPLGLQSITRSVKVQDIEMLPRLVIDVSRPVTEQPDVPGIALSHTVGRRF